MPLDFPLVIQCVIIYVSKCIYKWFWKELCLILNISNFKNSLFHLRNNGMVERFQYSLKNFLLSWKLFELNLTSSAYSFGFMFCSKMMIKTILLKKLLMNLPQYSLECSWMLQSFLSSCQSFRVSQFQFYSLHAYLIYSAIPTSLRTIIYLCLRRYCYSFSLSSLSSV